MALSNKELEDLSRECYEWLRANKYPDALAGDQTTPADSTLRVIRSLASPRFRYTAELEDLELVALEVRALHRAGQAGDEDALIQAESLWLLVSHAGPHLSHLRIRNQYFSIRATFGVNEHDARTLVADPSARVVGWRYAVSEITFQTHTLHTPFDNEFQEASGAVIPSPILHSPANTLYQSPVDAYRAAAEQLRADRRRDD